MLSIFFRKKIRNFIEKIIPLKIKFNNPKSKKIDKAIFVFGITDFFYRKQRWQFLSENFSKKIPVFYIDSNFYPKSRLKKNIFYHIYYEKNDLNIVKLSSDKNYFIYQEEPNIKGKNQIYESLINLINDYYIKKFKFIITHPFWHFLIDFFNKNIFIYDCLDDHEIFKENKKDINILEKKIINNSNCVVVTSKLLKEKIKKINKEKKIYLINNGVSNEFIHLGKDFLMKNQKNNNKKNKKIIGYIGEINWWFDEKKLEECLIYFKNKNILFYLAGRVNNQKINFLAKKYHNLKLFGEISHEKISDLLKTFDAGIIPFKINKFTNSINPVKIFEYFAFGLPVITSKLKELEKYKKYVYFYDEKNILEKINNALNEDNYQLKYKRNNIASLNKWEFLSNKYLKLIKF
ncbi:MAG: glycosyltransferase [Candidatus Goldbacteria bacterium]|nr:glycosyltransferase [Candidatus Goldiibacteriota bacterium]